MSEGQESLDDNPERLEIDKRIREAIIETLPPEVGTNLSNEDFDRLVTAFEFYAGPTPHPEILRQLDEYEAGAGAKVLNSALDGIRHDQRIELLREQTDAAHRIEAGRYSFIVAATGVIGAVATAIFSNSDYALIIAGIIVVTSIGGPLVARIIAEKIVLKGKDGASDDNK